MMMLKKIVKDLIDQKKEGDYWDFKQEYHRNPVDFVRDIICLANTVHHTGDRYLIFGVNNAFEIVGLDASKVYTQAKIIDMLRNARFANGAHPDVALHQLHFGEKIVEVLFIRDLSEKPYYLIRDYKKDRENISAGTVYTRVRDVNTPQDQVASASDIEKMWRERFGLTKSVYERFKDYLEDFNSWEETEDNHWHYNIFPEFTITPTKDETYEVEGSENWVRAATNPRAFVRLMHLKYHQTVIQVVSCIYYDEMRHLIPAPNAQFISDGNDKYFYSFCAEDFDFSLLQFFTKREKREIIDSGMSDGRIGSVPIVIFKSELEKEDFLTDVENVPVTVKDEHKFSLHRLDPRVSNHDREIISYSRAILERLSDFRSKIL